jgi:hypothetical protein
LLVLKLLKESNLVLSLLSIVSAFLLVLIGQIHDIISHPDDQLGLTLELSLLSLLFSFIIGNIFSIVLQFFQKYGVLFL